MKHFFQEINRAFNGFIVNLLIGGILLLAYETDTYVEFISPPPDFSRKNIKDTEFTLVMGHKELAQKLARKIRPILAQ